MYHCGHTISSEVENACIVIGFLLSLSDSWEINR
jgi:hypothetical protein